MYKRQACKGLIRSTGTVVHDGCCFLFVLIDEGGVSYFIII